MSKPVNPNTLYLASKQVPSSTILSNGCSQTLLASSNAQCNERVLSSASAANNLARALQYMIAGGKTKGTGFVGGAWGNGGDHGGGRSGGDQGGGGACGGGKNGYGGKSGRALVAALMLFLHC